MGVDDSPPGPVVAGIYRAPRRSSGPHLLFYPLEYKDVRVHAHADGQQYARNPRERERGVEVRHGPEEHDYVEAYGYVGYNA